MRRYLDQCDTCDDAGYLVGAATFGTVCPECSGIPYMSFDDIRTYITANEIMADIIYLQTEARLATQLVMSVDTPPDVLRALRHHKILFRTGYQT
jgi:hypothetical protein